MSIKLDTIQRHFNLYIRLKESDENGTCKCVSCGKYMHYKEANAGHFIDSTYAVHRFNEDNVHIQCPRCNSKAWLRGNKVPYTLWMINKYGKDFVEYLEGTKNSITRISQFERAEMSKKYRGLCRKLEKEKTIY